MTTNKTPIQELISLVLQDRSMVDKHELLGWMYKQGVEKEKAFAFDCYWNGAMSDQWMSHDDNFSDFYSQYAEQHNK